MNIVQWLQEVAAHVSTFYTSLFHALHKCMRGCHCRFIYTILFKHFWGAYVRNWITDYTWIDVILLHMVNYIYIKKQASKSSNKQSGQLWQIRAQRLPLLLNRSHFTSCSSVCWCIWTVCCRPAVPNLCVVARWCAANNCSISLNWSEKDYLFFVNNFSLLVSV